jgi:hypothetical protein
MKYIVSVCLWCAGLTKRWEPGRKPWEPGEPVRTGSGSGRFGTTRVPKFEFETKK